MQPPWVSKTDPEKEPIRFLAKIWQHRTGRQFTPNELPRRMGQIRDMRKELGDLTQFVIEWLPNPVNCWRFSQQVRAEAKMFSVPPEPDIGFVVWQRNRALNIIRRELRNSTIEADVNFCAKVDKLRFDGNKEFVVTFSQHSPERLVKAHAAKTLIDIWPLFIEVLDEWHDSREGATVGTH